MAYTKIVFQNSPSTATPLNAENLNHMDDQIALNDQRLTEIETSYVKSFNGRKGEVTPQANDYNMSQITPTNGATVGQIPVVRNDGTAEEPNLTFHMEDVPSSGHTIVDQDGNELTQEPKMKFLDAFIGDNSTDEVTEIENIKEVSPADYASTTDEGIIVTDDGNDALIGAVSDEKITVNGDNSKTLGTLLGEIATALDLTKLKPTSFLVHHNADGEDIVYQAGRILSNGIILTNKFVAGNGIVLSAMSITKNSVAIYKRIYTSSTGAITYGTSDILTSAESITLYYGNKKATVDLQTTANRCLMFDGNTVENELSVIDVKESFTAESCVNSYKAYKYGKFVVLNVELKNQTYTDGNLIITSKQGVNFDTTPLFTISAQLVNASNKVVTNGCIWIQTTREHRYFGDTITGKMYFTAIYLTK